MMEEWSLEQSYTIIGALELMTEHFSSLCLFRSQPVAGLPTAFCGPIGRRRTFDPTEWHKDLVVSAPATPPR